MDTREFIFLGLVSTALLTSCNKFHLRPSRVPSSAVWVDGTFVTCDVEESMKADRCSIFDDKTGAILADGLFVLDSSKREAANSVRSVPDDETLSPDEVTVVLSEPVPSVSP